MAGITALSCSLSAVAEENFVDEAVTGEAVADEVVTKEAFVDDIVNIASTSAHQHIYDHNSYQVASEANRTYHTHNGVPCLVVVYNVYNHFPCTVSGCGGGRSDYLGQQESHNFNY